ncbi:MAG: rod shape-determining protein RodA [Desulfomonile sp.]|jgi:rod shape determining protein RodA|nr:rod shape-determining protein RodA [Deltaproteobacteria bacterium]
MSIPASNIHWANRVLFEWPLIFISLVLAGIGLCLIFSATAPMGPSGRSFVVRQMTWFSLGLVITAIFLLFDYRILERWAVWFYVFIIVALVIVWSLGRVTAGSRRWIDLGLMRFQPSEFAKLAVVIVLAKYFQGRVGKAGLNFAELLQPFLLVVIPVLLVLIEPDLGTATVIVMVAISMILFTGVAARTLLWTSGLILVTLPLLIWVGNRLLLEYQKKRLLTFLSPDYDPLGAGYHIIQSQIAIGSGGLLGKGFLKGTQNQFMFLPVKHTDFIFSILAEEWGFVGCAIVLLLFCALLLRGFAIAGKARDDFGALVAFGCTAVLFWHVTINVGMVMGLLPVVGVPLSFLSYGGSSLLSSFLAVSVLVNVSMRRFYY